VTAVQVVEAVCHVFDLLPSTNTAPSPLSNTSALSSLQSTPIRTNPASHSSTAPSPLSNSSAVSGLQSTPLKTNSASHMDTRTTRSVIDPKIKKELWDQLWVDESNSFFDHFFPESFSSVTLPPLFPSHPTEDNVVKWVKDYHPIVGGAGSNPRSWSWESTSQRHRFQPTAIGERQVDLYTYSWGSSERNWSNVGVVSELKYRKNETSIGDFNDELLVQLSGYARQVFAAQPRRRFVHAFTLICARMRCWVFTRSGGVASPSFHLDTEDGRQRWRQVALNYLYSSDIGQAPSGQVVKVDSHTLRLKSPQPFFSTLANAIVTRGTTCWYASPSDSPSPLGGYPFVLKESWRFIERPSEGELLESANKAGVVGIAIHLAHHDDKETVHTILGPCREPTRRLDMQNTNHMARYHRPRNSKSSRSTPPNVATPLGAISEDADKVEKSNRPEAAETHSAEAITIPNRIRTVVVMSRGRAISKFTSPDELLLSFRDAIRGHRSLLTTGGILHRDISINNIMMTDPLYPRPDKFSGFLIDLDLAIRVGSFGIPCGAPHRTGTYEFMSIENLRAVPGFVHTFHDDLQSFFFVFLWLCYQQPEPNQRNFVVRWGSIEADIATNAKSALVNEETEFEMMLAGFKELTSTHAVRDAARKARAALWPKTTPGGTAIERNELQEDKVRDNVYKKFIAAFETGDTRAD
jgi:hypothetical protein